MTKLPQEAQKEIIKIVHEADDKKVAKDTVKEFVDAEREKKQKDNTPAYKKEGAHQKQTQSLARNNISQMDKEDVKKMLDSDYFNLGITQFSEMIEMLMSLEPETWNRIPKLLMRFLYVSRLPKKFSEL